MKTRLFSLFSVGMTLLAGTASATLVAHYTFNDPANPGAAAVGTAASLGKNASITTIDPAVGIGALLLTNNSGSDTSGSDGAVSGNNFSWSNDVRSVAFWMKAQGTQDSSATMISLGTGTSAGNRFDVRLDAGKLRLEVQSGGVTTGLTVGNGNWYHVTVVVPSNGATVANAQYFVHDTSASLVASGTFSGSSTAINTGTGPLRMGDGYQDGSRDFFGVLDDVRLYTSALTQTEAQALAALWAPGPVPGSPLTWAGTAGGGTWDLDTTAHWNDALSNPATFKNYDLVTFDDSATTGSVNLAGANLQPYSVTFANATLPYTLQGDAVSGFGSIVKSGAADVTLLIDNNRPGTTTISAGTLRFGNGGSTGSPGTGPIVNNGALVIARDGTVALSGGISGTGTLQIQGPGTTLLGGTNSYTGATTVGGGTLRVNGTLASPVTVNSAATIAAGPATGTGTATMGSLTLNPGSASSFRVGFTAGDKITVSNADGLNIGGAHNVSLIPTEEWLANDSFVLFDYNTSYLGNIANLQLGSMPHGTFSIQDNTANTEIRVTVDSLDTLVWKGNTAQPTLWDVNQTANWALFSNASAAPYFQYDKVLFDSTATNTSVVIQEPVSPMLMEFNFDAPTTYQFSGGAGITGAVKLDKTGTGTLVFGTPNSFNGATTINGGILRLIDGATWGGGTINNAGSLEIDRESDLSLTAALTGAGALVKDGGGILTLAGTSSSFSGPITINEGTLRPTASSALGSVLASVAINASGTLDTNGQQLGARPVTLAGGKITNAGNSQTNTIVNGTLTVTADSRLGGLNRWDFRASSGTAVVTVNSGVTLTKQDANLVYLNVGPGATIVNDGSIQVTGGELGLWQTTISGSGSFRVNSGGTLRIESSTNNPQALTLNGGTLFGNSTAATQSGPVTVNADSTVNTAITTTISGAMGETNGSHTLTKTGSSILLLSGANTFAGTLDIQQGLVVFSGTNAEDGKPDVTMVTGTELAITDVFVGGTATFGSLSGAGGIHTQYTSTAGTRGFEFEQSSDGTFAGVIRNGDANRILALTKSGDATLTLSGANTYTGATTVAAGTLRIGDGGVLGGGSYAGAITNNATLQFDSTANQTLSGALSGSGALLKTNTGTLILTANNNYEGGITIDGGTLQIGNNTTAGFIGNNATVTNNAAMVWFRSNTTNVDNNIAGTGTLTKLGAGSLNLNGNSTYTGATTVTTGILTVNGSLGNTAVTVQNGATLATNGNIGGSVTIQAGVTHSLAVAATPASQVTHTIGGTLDLSAAGDILDLIAASPPANGTYILVTASGGISGTPETVNQTGVSGTFSISGNNLVLTVGAASDYDDWAGPSGFNLTQGPSGDDDGDGLANFEEYAFGLNPKNPGNVSPVTAPDKTAGTFTYTRRKPSLTGLTYAYKSSTTLGGWTAFTPPTPDVSNNGDPVETITVTIPAALLAEPKLFIRVEATE